MESVTVKLSKPLSYKDGAGENATTVELTELTFREANVGDLIAGETVGRGGQTAQIAATLASMADLPFHVFRTLRARDFVACNEAAAPLLGNEPTPGDGAS